MRSIQQLLIDPRVQLLARVLVAFVLLSAGIGKIASGRRFDDIVRDYKLLPGRLIPLTARILPLFEVLVALWLLWGAFIPLPNLLAVFLFLVFSSAVAINLLRGRREISCGCFGSRVSHGISWSLVGRNLFFVALAAARIAFPAVGPEVSKSEALVIVFIAGMVLSCWWLLITLNRIWSLDLEPFLSAETTRSVRN
jgi:uncharacterized membrane protein YphA (DoxX/SURF4 family)